MLCMSCQPPRTTHAEEIRSRAVKILVVEDDPMSINLLKVALSAAGHEMVVARNGREVLDILRHNSIRFVISDWEMPEMSGVELCRRSGRRNSPATFTRSCSRAARTKQPDRRPDRRGG